LEALPPALVALGPRARLFYRDMAAGEFYRQYMLERNPQLLCDQWFVESCDRTGGRALNWTRRWLGQNTAAPDEVPPLLERPATLDARTLQEATPQKMVAFFEQGVAESRRIGYDGPGGVEVPPGEVPPQIEAALDGRPSGAPDPLYTPGGPLGPGLERYRADVEQTMADNPRPFFDKLLRESVQRTVSDTVEAMDEPFAKRTAEELTTELADRARWTKLGSDVHTLVMSYAGGSEQLTQIRETLGDDGTDALVRTIVSQDLTNRMLDDMAGSSWLTATVNSAVLEREADWLRRTADTAQERIVRSTLEVQTTSGELTAGRQALERIDAQLQKQPDNVDLVKAKREIVATIERETERQQRAEAERNEAEREARRTGERTVENEKRREAAEHEAKTRGEKVFHGE
jgi:hypothetical protein